MTELVNDGLKIGKIHGMELKGKREKLKGKRDQLAASDFSPGIYDCMGAEGELKEERVYDA